MSGLTFVLSALVAGIGFTATVPRGEARVGVEIGRAPDCPYGYYDVASN